MAAKTALGPLWTSADGTVATAGPGNTGLNVLTASSGNVTFQTAAGSGYPGQTGGTKILQWPEGVGGTFRLDAAYSTDLNASGKGVSVFFYLRLRKTAPSSYAADNTSIGVSTFMRKISATSKTRWYLDRIRNRASATFPATMDGISGIISSGMGGTTVNELGMNAAGDPPMFPLGVWGKFGERAYRHASAGRVTYSYNNCVFGEIKDLDTDTNTDTGTTMLNSDLQGDWTYTLPSVAGCTWELGAIESYTDSGTTDHGFTPVAGWNNFNASDYLKQFWGVTFRGSMDTCRYWDESLSGATIAAAAYSGSSSFGRNLLTYVGSAGGQTAAIVGNQNIGTLSFGDQGYCHLIFPLVYSPSNTTTTIVVKDSTNVTDLFTIAFNGANVVANGSTIGTHTPGHAYWIVISLGQNGDVRYWLHDMTTGSTGATRDWFLESTWTVVSALGKPSITAAFSAAATVRTDGMAVATRLTLSGFDSYSHTIVDLISGSDALVAAENHYSQHLCFNRQGQMIPGSAYRHYDLSSNPQPRRFCLPIGYTGGRFNTFVSNILASFDKLRGAEIFCFGMITNDINLGTATEAGMATVYTQAVSDLTTLVNYFTLRGNYVTLCDSLIWNYEATLDGTTNKLDRSGSTVTITYSGLFDTSAASYYPTGSKITIVGASNSELNVQAGTITRLTNNTATYASSGSGSISGASGKMRYFDDAQISCFKDFQGEVRRQASLLQRNSLVRFMPIASGLPVSAYAFSVGFTNEVHPSDAYKYLAFVYALENTRVYGTAPSPSLLGWSRGGSRRKAFSIR